MKWLLHALLIALGLPNMVFAQLGTALDIRMLPYELSLEKLPVDLTCVIGFVDNGGTVFVQDGTAGTHLHFKPARKDLRVGDRIRVKGTSMAGFYFPGVDVHELEIIGHEDPPQPVHAIYDDLATGRFHYQRVLVEGVGRTLTALDENRSLLRLAMGSRVIEVRVDAPLEPAPSIIDARLSITALAAGGINDRRQLVLPDLRVAEWDDITIVRSAPEGEKLPVTSAANLLQFGTADEPHHRVRIRGTVLAALNDGRVFLRDATPPPPPRDAKADEPLQSPSIAIRLIKPQGLEIGHFAEVLGFPIMQGFSASLADAVVLSTEKSNDPKASFVTLLEFRNGSRDSDLVHLATPAVLNDFFRTPEGYELRFTSEGVSIRAFLLERTAPSLEIGSICSLTGICLIESSTDKGFRSQPERASLLLRTSQDLQVLSTAPFWTAKRLIITIILLGSIVLLTLIWISLQRRQISRLEQKVAHQATREERQRIAREFHDTLEQELAGLSLRLDAAATRPLDEKARKLLETSRSLVSRIQSEARNLVSDLREIEQAPPLPAALQQLGSRIPEGIQVILDLSPIATLPPHITHDLRMIAQESITNAIKHSTASQITLHLSSTPSLLTLRVTDNGQGFDPQETNGKPGHFGCMGIRERARKIGAEVTWDSVNGQGTSVRLSLPLVKKNTRSA